MARRFESQDLNENRNVSRMTMTVDLNEVVKDEYVISVGELIFIFPPCYFYDSESFTTFVQLFCKAKVFKICHVQRQSNEGENAASSAPEKIGHFRFKTGSSNCESYVFTVVCLSTGAGGSASGGGGLHPGVVRTPAPSDTTGYGGTHPTGIHSN